MRYYDPEAGRFISRDPLGMWGDPGQRGNAQNYCGNNPVNFVDPMGLDSGSWRSVEGEVERENNARASRGEAPKHASTEPAERQSYDPNNRTARVLSWFGGHLWDILEPDSVDAALFTGAVYIPDIGPTECGAAAIYLGRRFPKIAGKIDDLWEWAKKAAREAAERARRASKGPEPAVAGGRGRNVNLSEAFDDLAGAGRRGKGGGRGGSTGDWEDLFRNKGHGADFEDLGLLEPEDLARFVDDMLEEAATQSRKLERGREAFFDPDTGMLVIRDALKRVTTVFKPERGIDYFNDSLR